MKKDRRNFLRTVGTFLGGVALAGCGAAIQPQTRPVQTGIDHLISSYDGSNSVDHFVANFPRDLPGAARIDIPIHNLRSNRCLIHIKNSHYAERSSRDELAAVETVQDDVELILLHLINHNSLQAAYKEGRLVGIHITPQESANLCERRRRTADNMLQEVLRYEEMLLEGESAIFEQARNEAQMNYDLVQRRHHICEQIIDRSIRYSAINRLNVRGLLEIRATETREIYDRSIDVQNRILATNVDETDVEIIGALLEDRAESFAERERFVLQEVVRNGDGVGVTVFGGDHDFGPDIVEWNADEQMTRDPNYFSLITIIPASDESHYA